MTPVENRNAVIPVSTDPESRGQQHIDGHVGPENHHQQKIGISSQDQNVVCLLVALGNLDLEFELADGKKRQLKTG